MNNIKRKSFDSVSNTEIEPTKRRKENKTRQNLGNLEVFPDHVLKDIFDLLNRAGQAHIEQTNSFFENSPLLGKKYEINQIIDTLLAIDKGEKGTLHSLRYLEDFEAEDYFHIQSKVCKDFDSFINLLSKKEIGNVAWLPKFLSNFIRFNVLNKKALERVFELLISNEQNNPLKSISQQLQTVLLESLFLISAPFQVRSATIGLCLLS